MNYKRVTRPPQSQNAQKAYTYSLCAPDKTCGGDPREEEGGGKQALGDVLDEKVRSLQVVALAHCVSLPRRNCTLDSDLLNNPGLL